MSYVEMLRSAAQNTNTPTSLRLVLLRSLIAGYYLRRQNPSARRQGLLAMAEFAEARCSCEACRGRVYVPLSDEQARAGLAR